MKQVLLLIMLSTAALSQNIWQQVPSPNTTFTPSDLKAIAVDASGCGYVGDRQGSGVWKSCNLGTAATWTQANTGITGAGCGSVHGIICVWSLKYDSVNHQLVVGICSNCDGSGVTLMFRSTNSAASWTPITFPAGIGFSNSPNLSGPAVRTSDGFAIAGGHYIAGGLGNDNGVFWSSSAFSTNTASTISSNGACGSTIPLGSYGTFYNSVANNFWSGTEQCGWYVSSDGKSFTGVTPGSCSGPANPCVASNFGNHSAAGFDNSGALIYFSANAEWKTAPGSGTYTVNGYGTTKMACTGCTSLVPFSIQLKDPILGNFYAGQNRSSGDNVSAVFRSVDQGVSWAPWTSGVPLNSAGGNMQMAAAAFNTADNRIYAIMFQGGSTFPLAFIYRTVNPISGTGPPPPPPPPTGLAVVVR